MLYLETASTPSSSSSSSSYIERNEQLLDRFLQSVKSKVTQVNAIDYIHAYMRHWHLYEEEKEQDLLNDDGRNSKKKKQKRNNNVIYRYDWLIGDDGGRYAQASQNVSILLRISQSVFCSLCSHSLQ